MNNELSNEELILVTKSLIDSVCDSLQEKNYSKELSNKILRAFGVGLFNMLYNKSESREDKVIILNTIVNCLNELDQLFKSQNN